MRWLDIFRFFLLILRGLRSFIQCLLDDVIIVIRGINKSYKNLFKAFDQ